MAKQMFSHLLVMDFEATCWDKATSTWDGVVPPTQEIIEFPCVVIDTSNGKLVAEFHRFVRPTENITLSAFCTELTGIEQKQVDAAATLQEVLTEFVKWVGSSSIWKSENEIAIVTCGDWDLNIGIRIEATRKGFVDQVPTWMQRWVNIKKTWMKATGNTRATGMAGMLRDLDIELIGKHHSGIDDARNIARIVQTLLAGGAVFEGTGQWPGGRRTWAAKKEAKEKLKKEKQQTEADSPKEEDGQALALVDLDST